MQKQDLVPNSIPTSKLATDISRAIYHLIIEKGQITTSETTLKEVLGWDASDLSRGIKYLYSVRHISAIKMLDGSFKRILLTGIGIAEVEQKGKIKKRFGLSVGVPGFSAQWNTEKEA